MPRFSDRLKHAWSAFFGRDAPDYRDYGPGNASRPDGHRLTRGNSRSIVAVIQNRISMDCAAIPIKHVRLDETGRFGDVIEDSSLNECLTVEANADQTGRAFVQDAVFSMLDEGCVAIIPVETSSSPLLSDSYQIKKLRTGKVIQWYPKHVMVEFYNEETGQKIRRTYPKRMVALPENPFYAVMNEPNSTLQRLQRKLTLLDIVDEQTNSGRLNMIVQVPYSSRRDLDKKRAEQRRKDIEDQLVDSKYGIAYMDGTENVIQVNRPLENGLLDQIKALREELYNQMGLTPEVFNGSATEDVMTNYNNRTIEPILSAITDEMRRKFLSKTARTQGQNIMFFIEPFKLLTLDKLADIADVLARNEILSSNEFRALLGYKPADSERANELINKNMPVEDVGGDIPMTPDQEGMPTGQEEFNVMDVPIEQVPGYVNQEEMYGQQQQF